MVNPVDRATVEDITHNEAEDNTRLRNVPGLTPLIGYATDNTYNEARVGRGQHMRQGERWAPFLEKHNRYTEDCILERPRFRRPSLSYQGKMDRHQTWKAAKRNCRCGVSRTLRSDRRPSQKQNPTAGIRVSR